MSSFLIQNGNLDTDMHRCEQTQGEDDHLQTKEKGMEQTLPS